jgi:hypothetical protein
LNPVVIAQHKDILVVGLHKITLTGYLLNQLGVPIQLLYLCLVVLVLFRQTVYLILQLTDMLTVHHVFPHAVLVKKSNESDGYHCHQDVFQTTDMVETEEQILNLLHLFLSFRVQSYEINHNSPFIIHFYFVPL